MNKFIELPLIEPVYQTLQSQGASTAVFVDNPSIRNWCLNEVMNLTCNRKFLNGYTSPKITIENSSWNKNPYLEIELVSRRFSNGYINPIIRNMLDEGYYVFFNEVDDYYVEGKSWYKENHFSHDALICGYNQNDKTYCLYSYDSNWIYRKFWTSQASFNRGRIARAKIGKHGHIWAIRPKSDLVVFSPETAYKKLLEYLDSSLEKYPKDGEGDVFGIIVHEYIADYVNKLYDGSIPYNRMDRRVFRMIWEHKKVMLERIERIEQSVKLNNEISNKYRKLVSEADMMRMLYASHHMKRRDSVLPIIKKKLLNLMEEERRLLTLLVDKAGKELNNETLDVS